MKIGFLRGNLNSSYNKNSRSDGKKIKNKGMKAKLIFIGLVVLSVFTVNAQKGVDTGTRYGLGEDSIRCLENISLYQNYYHIKDYNTSVKYWEKVIDENNGEKSLTQEREYNAQSTLLSLEFIRKLFAGGTGISNIIKRQEKKNACRNGL